MTHCLIDGDPIIYRSGFAAQRTWYDVYDPSWGEAAPPVASFSNKRELNAWLSLRKDESYQVEPRIEVEPIANALHNVNQTLRTIVRDTGATTSSLYLTGRGNFRDTVATLQGYKANRDPTHKPLHYDAIKEYLIERHDAVVVEGYEADDAVAIKQYEALDYQLQVTGDIDSYDAATIICTIDKDLDMVPGWHYNYGTKAEPYWVDELEGLRFFYTQMLTGDSTDNIPGLYKLTGQKATKQLKDPLQKMEEEKEMYAWILKVYQDYWKDGAEYPFEAIEDCLTEIGQLLWMQRYEGEIWQPPIQTQDSQDH